jgi:hypothetical protein
MWRFIFTSIVLLAGVSGEAIAIDCNSGQIKNDNNDPNGVANAISGKTVCATLAGQKWQEYHRPGGNLIDYKKGPTNAVDPSKQVGSWITSGTGGNSQVTYNYGTGGSYSYKIHLNNGTFTFCGVNPSPTLDVTLLSGQVPCGS